MNSDVKNAFTRIKPVCDVLMVGPTNDSIAAFIERVTDLKREVVQELQQYLLFPLITHLDSTEIEDKHDLLQKLVDAMKAVLDKVVVNSFDMCMKIELALMRIVFDNTRPGMIADVPEELKLSVMNCITVLLLNVHPTHREAMLKTNVLILGKAVYVCVHIAKLERLRALRLAAIHAVTAHTATHPKLTTNYHIQNPTIEKLAVEMLSLILPGVLGALQDVATCNENPGHVLVVTAIDAMHRILCLTMNNKFMSKTVNITVEDFANVFKEKEMKEVSSKVDPKTLPNRSPEWFYVAGEKLQLITRSLVSLRTHEHFKVRKELAVFCSRLLFECSIALESSVPLALDALLLLTKDEYPEVSAYCANTIKKYFSTVSHDIRAKTLDALCDNFFTAMSSLPRVMNNIDSSRKLSSLNLVHGYLWVLACERRAARLTSALSVHHNVQLVCVCLVHCLALHHDLAMFSQHTPRDITAELPVGSPWCKLKHLDDPLCERRMQEILCLLAQAECSSLLLDKLFEMFEQDRACEIAYILNWMSGAPQSSKELISRVLNKYIEDEVWYLPLEVGSTEPVLTEHDTLDVSVYNPSSWDKDSVPGLFEGAVETRYTDISYQTPRPRSQRDPNCCGTLGDAQRNMFLSCLLTEGVGVIAARLLDNYQPYLLKTLCMVLERVGSKYEMLHLAGLKAIHNIAKAGGHASVADLIKANADYFTHQVTVRLKKAWNIQSALQILSVVMEYSDESIMNYLYGIVQDVLVQSCDKYYEKDLYAYLQVFLTFVDCIRKWYTIPEVKPKTGPEPEPIDVTNEVKVFIENQEEVERLLSEKEFEKETGMSVEEMYQQDVKKKEEEILDYDDTVTEEKPPPPQYVAVVVTILKRCLNFVTTSDRDNSILALRVLTRGLPILRQHKDELLPIIHLAWRPLVNRFEADTVIMKRAFDLLVTMAELAKDFIRARAVTDVLPHIYNFLRKSSKDSYLKDVGSAYRNSQAFSLQETALAALPRLATDLMLEDEALEDAMSCVQPYLSRKQPKPLQSSAVEFFRTILWYDYCAAWYHLRQLCNNDQVVQPPSVPCVHLVPLVGTPYQATDKDYEKNVKLIFNSNVVSQ